MKIILVFLAIAAALWQPAAAQTAPDLGILWQKEYPGIDIQFAKFSKDGQYIYFSSDKKIGILSVDTGELLPGFDFEMGYYAIDFNISGNGNYLIVTSGAGTTYVFDVNSKTMIKEISKKTLPTITNTYSSDISPDGSLLYIGVYAQGGYYILIYNILQDKEITRFKIEGQIRKIKLSHNGMHLVTGTYYEDQFTKKAKNKLILWETGTWQQAAVLEDVEASPDGYSLIKFSPNDKYLVCDRIGPVMGNRIAEIFDLATKSMLKSTNPVDVCFNVEFLPDNQHYLQSIYTSAKGLLLELHSLNDKIKEFSIRAGVIETFDSNGTWKIFCHNIPSNTMLTNKPTSVIEVNPDNNIRIYYENNRIILETIIHNIPILDITISDISGKIVYQDIKNDIQGNSKYYLETNLLAGVYLAKVISGDKKYSFKFEVAR